MIILLAAQLDTLDRVAAVVDDRAIWLSDVDERALLYAATYGIPPQQLPSLRREVLQQMVNTELLYLKIREDTTIHVSEDEVERAIDMQLQQMRGNMSEEEFEKKLKEAGFTLESYRRYLRDDIRKTLYIQKYVEMKLKPRIKVSDKEVEEAYRTLADSLATPPEFKLAVITLMVKPSASAEQEYYAKAKRIYRQLKRGANWEEMVQKYSDDRESAKIGGDLGIVPKDALPPNFVKEIERTPEGSYTKPLRGPQGYHIFYVKGKRKDAYLLAHILVKVTPSEADVKRVMRKAKSIVKKLKAGYSFAKLAKRYSDDPVSKENGGEIGWVSAQALPPDIVEKLKEAKPGDIVGPIPTPDGSMINIFKVLDVQEGRKPTKEQIRQILLQRKIEEELNKLVEEARKDYYVKIYL